MSSYGLSLLGAFRRVAIPLGAYYVVTLLIPFANGAVGMAFAKHAIVVLVVPVVLIGGAHAVWWATRALVRGAARTVE
jgi:hypothetical protein